ncbi:glycoside hydrolase domain-containing protein [Jidongwangia harbinensis]|uniref:glycoside hydrolase domain-containing protein n=1 Tax=Jidongwangia harbinensis TaxID=2878561 RepID=UPI001CD9D4FE|nr:glycoside hydrolase domain-containing protein [Jidongwangia harbinensis]MCA2218990.1 DUF1906 domain-containing protein [Jidongwangia harbinensis]
MDQPRRFRSHPPAGRVAIAAATGLVSAIALAAPWAPPAAADPGAQPGTYTGPGFDACTAPSSATMQAWLESPYRALGIYFGGNNRACTQPNLTAEWVTEQQAAGWHLMPIYLGPQASCTTSNKRYRIDDTQAAVQGRAAADDAVVQAQAIGLARESVLIYDMEAYATGNATCRAGVYAFLSAWTARLHDHGYLSGFYSSMSSGVADQVANYTAAGYVRPDYLDFARWDNVATVTDSAIPAAYWSPHRRIKQYRGGHDETWGGVTVNVDNDYLDVAPLPSARFADFTGNGWSDVLGVARSLDALVVYPGNGTVLQMSASQPMGTGWTAMNAVLRIGDRNGDGHEDVLARQASNGDLWFHPGTGSGLGDRTRAGAGWNTVREMTAPGDFNRDGYPDLIAVQGANLYLYRSTADGQFTPRVQIGTGGWDAMSELAGVGDFDRDGYTDMVARSTNGNLYLYPGRGNGFAARKQVGTGWGAMRDLVGVGDFNRDGYTDLAAATTSSGVIYLYPGTGTGLRARVQIGAGSTSRTPLA